MKVYVIKGDPIPMGLAKSELVKHVWDIRKTRKEIVLMDLEMQHQSNPLLKGKLHLSATFFMPHKRTAVKDKNQSKAGEYHYSKPRLSELIRFVEQISKGVIYAQDGSIGSISTKKVYDANPRIEFSFKELK